MRRQNGRKTTQKRNRTRGQNMGKTDRKKEHESRETDRCKDTN